MFFSRRYFGAVAGNPADLALVRIQADNTLPVQDRRGYRNVFDAFYNIGKYPYASIFDAIAKVIL
jgi:hypothetical protein